MFPTIPHPQDRTAIYRALDGLLASLEGTSRHDQAILAINLCIEFGINTRSRIIGVLTRKDFTRGHIAQLLNENTGANLNGNHWFADAGGLLQCHPETA